MKSNAWIRVAAVFFLAGVSAALFLGLLSAPRGPVYASGSFPSLSPVSESAGVGVSLLNPTVGPGLLPPWMQGPAYGALEMQQPSLLGSGAVITVCLPVGICDYSSIQDALGAAADGDTIKVAQGVYSDAHTMDGRDQIVYIAKAVTLQGGYTLTNWTLPDPDGHPTVLDGRGSYRVVYIAAGVEPTVTLSGFYIRNGQSSTGGGGVYIAGGEPVVQGNRIFGSHGDSYGGGVYIAGGAPLLENNLIYANTTANYGGGVYVLSGSPRIQYNTIYDNQAGLGGGVYVASGTPVLRANIIAQNTATSGGGGLYRGGGNFTPVYNDVWNNTGGDYSGFPSTPATDFSADPRFEDAAGGDFRLQDDSPCIEAGDPAVYPAQDYDGYVRPFGVRADVGAHEDYRGSCFVRVEESRVYTTVQDAIAAAGAGAEVWIAGRCADDRSDEVASVDQALTLRGGYTLTNWSAPDPMGHPTVLDGEGARRVLRVRNNTPATIEGLHIRNGYVTDNGGAGIYVGDGSNVQIRNNWIYSNTVEGNWPGGGVYIAGNALQVIVGNEIYGNAVLGNGRGGGIYVANGGGNQEIENNRIHHNAVGTAGGGGGIAVNGGGGQTVRVQGNEIYSNTSRTGGGIQVDDGIVEIVENDIYSNVVTSTQQTCGGGILVAGGQVTIEDNDIYGNREWTGDGSDNGGGGIYLSGGDVTVRGNRVHDNAASKVDRDPKGGGMYVWASGAKQVITVEQNLVYGNTVTRRGGGLFLRSGNGSNLTVRNNVIYGNTSDDYGGGINFQQQGGSILVENNVIYDNQADPSCGGGIYRQEGSATVRNNIVVDNVGGGIVGTPSTYCDVWDNDVDYVNASPGSGSFSQDPLFVDAAGGDFRLQAGSPCRDAADPVNYPPYDFDGYARPFGARGDIGAHEYYTGTCFARLSGGGQVYTSVQTAVNTAVVSGENVLVAGNCVGDRGRVTIDGPLALRGGYTIANWISPTTATTLDALHQGRVLTIDVGTPTATVTVERFVIRGGYATVGGGMRVEQPLSPTLRNLIFFDNRADVSGGGFSSRGGNPSLLHVTVVSNSALTGGGVYFFAGRPTVYNSILVSNTATNGGGLFAESGSTPTLDYDDVWGNVAGSHPGANVFTGTHSLSADPRFEGDYYLGMESPCLHRGAWVGVGMDLEGDLRGQDSGPDLGADERSRYPDLRFTPSHLEGYGLLGEVTEYTHYLTNTGSVTDTYILTHTLTYSGGIGWAVDYPDRVTLSAGEATAIPVALTVPTDSISGTWAVVTLTATSGWNGWVHDVVSDTTLVARNPGVHIEPTYDTHVNPGAVFTYVHTLINTGNGADSFSLTLSSTWGWTTVSPTQIVNLGPHAQATLWVRVEVPATAPGGLVERIVLTANSSDSGVGTTIVDTVEVNHVPGDRFVASGGDDTLNNCLVADSPCRTMAYAIGQATQEDTVKVAAGTYYEHNIVLNKNITLRGGHDPANEWYFDPEATPSVVDAQNQGRVFKIFGSPTVEGFTLQGGLTDGAGGAIYVEQGAPTIERNRITGNRANRGGGLAVGFGNPTIWNNFVYENEAVTDGGGMYVAGGGGRVWHNTFYSNTAVLGGGLYVADSLATFKNLILAQNDAQEGGGVYGNVTLYTSDIWQNVGGGCAGGANCAAIDGNVDQDPLFVDPANGDLHIQSTSPCRDAGDVTSLEEDYDVWEQRPMGVGLTPPPDIGADEFFYPWVVLEPDRFGRGYPNGFVMYTHTLTNTGNRTDSFILSAYSAQGWPITPTAVVTVEPDVSVMVPVSVTIPDGVFSGTVDVGVITATSRFNPAAFDTAVDTTMVGLTTTVVFTPSRMALVDSDPGSLVKVFYTHTLINGINYTSTFDFLWGGDDTLTVVLPSSVTLTSGMSVTVGVTITVPPMATDEVLADTKLITAVSRLTSLIFDVVTDTTYVNVRPGVALEPNRQGSGKPGEYVHYTHTLNNGTNYTDTFTLEAASAMHWEVSVASPIALGPGITQTVPVTVRVPAGAFSGTVDTEIVTVTSSFDPQVYDTVVNSTTVERVVDVAVSGFAPSAMGWCFPPEELPYEWSVGFSVKNQGNWADTFTLIPHSDRGLVLTTSLSAPSFMGGAGWQPGDSRELTLTLASGGTMDVWVYMWVTGTTAVQDTVYLTATSQADTTVSDGDFFINCIHCEVDIELSPPVTQTVFLEQVITYTHIATYTGDWAGSVKFSAQAQSGWKTKVFPSSQAMQPGDVITVQVRLEIPLEDVNEVGQVTISAQTLEHCIDEEEVTDTILVRRPHVSLAPDHELYVQPMTVVTFPHQLTNDGVYTDSYTLTWEVPPGWGAAVTPLAVSDLPPNTTVSVTAVVSVPWVLSDTVGSLLITATSAISDIIYGNARDDMTVVYVPGAMIAPDGFGAADPNGYVTYTHVLTNTGNYTESFDLTTHSAFGYAVVSPTHIGLLAAGEAFPGIVARVQLPAHASQSETEQTEVIATFLDQQTVALDFTAVNAVSGTRYVATNGSDGNNNCTRPLEYGPCATIQHAVDEAVPEDEIRVAEGTYDALITVVIADEPYTQVVYLDRSVTLQGGYALDAWDIANPVAHLTVLDAGGQGRVIYVAKGVSPTVAGFHLTGGAVEGAGAGVYVAANAEPTLRDNWIHDNTASGTDGQGGGVYVAAGDSRLEQNTIYANVAEDGAGVYVADGSPQIWNNVVYTNAAGQYGGGIYLASPFIGAPTVWNNTLYSNTAFGGGGIFVASGYPVISNTIVVENSDGLFRQGGIPALAYNDVWGNEGGDYGGGITGTQGSISAAPLFVAEASGDFRLRRGSPCVDAGDPHTGVGNDRLGNRRPLRSGYDIGAYEQGVSLFKVVTSTAKPGAVITYTVLISNVGDVEQPVSLTDMLHPALLCDDGRLEVPNGSGTYWQSPCSVMWNGTAVAGEMTRVTFTARVAWWLAPGAIITNVAWVNGDATGVVTTTVLDRPGPRYVASTGDDVGNSCLDPAHPCSTLSYAVERAWDGDPVLVATGVYTGAGAAAVVTVTGKSLSLLGGYTPTLPAWNYAPDLYTTTLDATGIGRGIVITGPGTVTVAGFSVMGASTGIEVALASVEITRCRVYAQSDDGIRVADGELTLARSWVYDNGGDGIEFGDGDYRLDNSVVADNGGAGLRATGAGNGFLRHNTFARNGAAGAVVDDRAWFTNTIFYSHTVGVDAGTFGHAVLSYTLWYSHGVNKGDIRSGPEWVADPVFLDPNGRDYHMGCGSAALDRGVDAGLDEDVDGDLRPVGRGWDLGADELFVSLQVHKSVTPTSVAAGAPLTYTIRVTNTGQFDLHAVITDELPITVTPTGVLTWTAAITTPDGVWSVAFPVTTSWRYTGTLHNVVRVGSLEGATGVATATAAVEPPDCPVPLEGVLISGPTHGYTGTAYVFTVGLTPVTPTPPVLYTWSPVPDQGQGTSAVTYTWAMTGVYRLTATVENCSGVVSDTHTITIAQRPWCVPLSGVQISGPDWGYVDEVYAFDAITTPVTATTPIMYTWSPSPMMGQGTGAVTYAWGAMGTYTLTLRAENCGPAVTATHRIRIEQSGWRIYLPVVLRTW